MARETTNEWIIWMWFGRGVGIFESIEIEIFVKIAYLEPLKY